MSMRIHASRIHASRKVVVTATAVQSELQRVTL